MWTQIYAIYDKKAEQLLGGLITIPNDEAAARLFADSARAAGQGHVLYDHLEDFKLIRMGELNQLSGHINQKRTEDTMPFDDPKNVVITGTDVIRAWQAFSPDSASGAGKEPPAPLSLTGL